MDGKIVYIIVYIICQCIIIKFNFIGLNYYYYDVNVIIRNIMIYNILFCSRSQQKRYKGLIEGRTFISPKGFFLERFFDGGRKFI